MNRFSVKQLRTLTEAYRRLWMFHKGNVHKRLITLSTPSEMKTLKDYFVCSHTETPKVRNWYHLTKKGKIIGPMDLLISAQAKSKKLILVTNNVKEFERVNGIKIENWV